MSLFLLGKGKVLSGFLAGTQGWQRNQKRADQLTTELSSVSEAPHSGWPGGAGTRTKHRPLWIVASMFISLPKYFSSGCWEDSIELELERVTSLAVASDKSILRQLGVR